LPILQICLDDAQHYSLQHISEPGKFTYYYLLALQASVLYYSRLKFDHL